MNSPRAWDILPVACACLFSLRFLGMVLGNAGVNMLAAFSLGH